MDTMNGRALGLGTFRLPTEAEWEYACRAGTTTYAYWGDTLDANYCWYGPSGGAQPVKGKLPNAWNLYDMLGNVSEFTGDWYALYTSSPQTDPSPSGSMRPWRGGNWNDSGTFCRSSNRGNINTSFKDYTLGFRAVLTPAQ